jgi:hypothetical protein
MRLTRFGSHEDEGVVTFQSRGDPGLCIFLSTPPLPSVDGIRRSIPFSGGTPQPHGCIKTIPSAKRPHLIPTPFLGSSSSTMERSSTIFAISSHFYDNPHNRGRYHRAAGVPAATPHRGDAQKRPPTYTWFVEEELKAISKEISETRQWAFEQQAYFGLLPKDDTRRTARKRSRSRDAGPAGRDLDETLAWLRGRLRAAEFHAERSQLQEEFDKMEARWQERIGREERHRRQEQQWAEDQRARAEREKQLERRSQEEAWKVYERRWATVASEGGQLKFKSIPWPTTVQPGSVQEITPDAITKFIFSSAHSEGMSRKERVKNALRRWHPDRFGRMLSRVDEKDKRAVERGVGIVARRLNELLAQEN